MSAIARNTTIKAERFPSLAGQGAISIDCETFDPDLKTRGPGPHRDGYIAGIAVGTEAGYRNYFPIAHETGPNLPKAAVLSWLSRELQSDVPKIGANLIYDLAFLSAAGVNVRGPLYDVQIAEPLLDETRLSYSLETLAQHYLGKGKVNITLRLGLPDTVARRTRRRTFGERPTLSRHMPSVTSTWHYVSSQSRKSSLRTRGDCGNCS